MDASHVYVRARALGCFHSLISTETFRRALTGSVDSCAETECPFSGVTKSGRVWKNGSESDSRSVPRVLTNADDSWVFVDGVEEVLTMMMMMMMVITTTTTIMMMMMKTRGYMYLLQRHANCSERKKERAMNNDLKNVNL